MSNGDEGEKTMYVGKHFANKLFIDIINNRQEEITIIDNEVGKFKCNGGSVWISK